MAKEGNAKVLNEQEFKRLILAANDSLHAEGADIKTVSRLAGHASIVITAIYVEYNPDRLKRIINLAVF